MYNMEIEGLVQSVLKEVLQFNKIPTKSYEDLANANSYTCRILEEIELLINHNLQKNAIKRNKELLEKIEFKISTIVRDVLDIKYEFKKWYYKRVDEDWM